MTAFFDTSVLVAAFLEDHPRHDPSLDVYSRFGQCEACCAAHSLAEVYATLTAMPGRWRLATHEVMLVLREVREHLTLVALEPPEYIQVLEDCAGRALASGAVYDALLGACALKAGAETVYTWDVGDFQRLGPQIASRVRTPLQA
ncbi:MAG: PIN domain-containing protein [Terriglobales bacterium]